MKKQQIFENYKSLEKIIKENEMRKIFIVCSKFVKTSFIMDYIKTLPIDFVCFNDYQPNPLYEDVLKGIEIFKKEKCEAIISIGGGSAIDTAKCIKLFSTLDSKISYLKQEFAANNIKHIAIPTTAGTGSESTRFAVIYYNGEKQTITHESIIPEYAILEPRLLEALPIYQKKATLMDTLCQAIESYWSVNSTEESKTYAKEAIELILANYEAYLQNDLSSYPKILKASNLSGKAINISQTTAAHAMSYKITSLYGIAHGHAVALTLPHIWEHMINNLDKCIDPRGKEYLQRVFNELNNIFNSENSLEAINKFKAIFNSMNLEKLEITDSELNILTNSVNPIRLKNNPIKLTNEDIEKIYIKTKKTNEKIYLRGLM